MVRAQNELDEVPSELAARRRRVVDGEGDSESEKPVSRKRIADSSDDSAQSRKRQRFS